MNPAHPPAAPEHVRRLVTLGYVSLAVALVFLWQKQEWENPLLGIANLTMLALGIIPLLRWLQRNDATYPIMEFLLLTTVPFYAIPALTNHEALVNYPEEIILRSALVVIAFQLSCIGGSIVAAQSYRPRAQSGESWWRTAIMPDEKMGFTAYTALVATAWVAIATFTSVVPPAWIGTLRAIFFGIGIISVFVQARLWGAGQLSNGMKTLFVFNIALQVGLTFVSLLLINGMSLLLTAGIGYFSVARRVPWLPVVLILPVLAILHNGKSQMRLLYWEGKQASPSLAQLPAYFTQWIELGLSRGEEIEEKNSQALTYGLMRRASLFQIVCVAVDTMPDRTPFLHGETYSILLPQIAPRFLWPNKPSPHLSVKILSVQLGVLSMEEAESTSVGFGMLTEAYANFGMLNVALLGAIFGWLFRRLALVTEHSATLSPAGLFRILCLVWCLSAETTLAVWFSSLYQACIAIGVPLLGLRSIFSK
ncbi:MAG: hypothetical protein C0518_09245 [Opitutus sp.]|nr:hypothetical protein [Opitutus sp.]